MWTGMLEQFSKESLKKTFSEESEQDDESKDTLPSSWTISLCSLLIRGEFWPPSNSFPGQVMKIYSELEPNIRVIDYYFCGNDENNSEEGS